MTIEHLSGPRLLRAMADAQEQGEPPEEFEAVGSNYRWVSCHSWESIMQFDRKNMPIRKKPKTRHLIDIYETVYEWPKPLTKFPANGEPIWIPGLGNKCPQKLWRENLTIGDLLLVRHGIAQETEDGAWQLRKALLAATGGVEYD